MCEYYVNIFFYIVTDQIVFFYFIHNITNTSYAYDIYPKRLN